MNDALHGSIEDECYTKVFRQAENGIRDADHPALRIEGALVDIEMRDHAQHGRGSIWIATIEGGIAVEELYQFRRFEKTAIMLV